jgi:SAM-dependent methyltransferase
MSQPDPFGRALLDHHRDEREAPLWTCYGSERREHPVERFYFAGVDENEGLVGWLDGRLDGPLLDLGAGAGRHALHFQRDREVVAVEPSEHLVTTMRERGVEDARKADMFDLRASFDRDRFRSAVAYGTQVQLASSPTAFRGFLADLAHVTTDDGRAALHGYDPTLFDGAEMLGYERDPTPGVAFRTTSFEYEGDRSAPLRFRLFSLDRLRALVAGSAWRVADAAHVGADAPDQWLALLEKR